MDQSKFVTKMKLFLASLINKFYENGGFKSKRNLLFILCSFWAYYVFLRERGALPFKKSLSGKHVYLTGAGSGLGRHMALKLAKMGAKLTLSDINEQGLLETESLIKKEVTSHTPQVACTKLDVSHREDIKRSAEFARSKFGDVDVIINNAGIVQGRRLMDCSEDLMSKVLVVNMESHLWIIREFLPAMIRKNSGSIVSIASMAGIGGQPFMTDYSASKAGAIGMMDALRLELKRENHNVRCTTICPFYINTGMFDGVDTGSLYGFLDQDRVVDRIISSIRQEEEVVCLPWSMGPICFLTKGIFGTGIADYMVKLVVGWDTMANFRGRQDKNAIFQAKGKQ